MYACGSCREIDVHLLMDRPWLFKRQYIHRPVLNSAAGIPWPLNIVRVFKWASLFETPKPTWCLSLTCEDNPYSIHGNLATYPRNARLSLLLASNLSFFLWPLIQDSGIPCFQPVAQLPISSASLINFSFSSEVNKRKLFQELIRIPYHNTTFFYSNPHSTTNMSYIQNT
jgi:hypothetical protein